MKSKRSLEKRLCTLKEAANYLGRSDWSVRELIWSGRLPIVREEGSNRRVTPAQNIQFMLEYLVKSYSNTLSGRRWFHGGITTAQTSSRKGG